MAPLPIGFYTFLRFAVSIAGIWIAIVAAKSSQAGWVVIGVVVVVVFNPLVPVWLTKEIWVSIDLIAAIAVATAGFRVRGPVG